MKNLLILSLFATLFFSCSKDEPTASGFVKIQIVNRWVSVDQVNDYKSREFREDGLYLQDGSNLGLGTGTGAWYWGNGDSLWVSYAENSSTPQVKAFLVTKLSSDSLVFRSGSTVHRAFRQ